MKGVAQGSLGADGIVLCPDRGNGYKILYMVTIHIASGHLVLSTCIDSVGEDERSLEMHVSDACTTMEMYLMPRHCPLKNT